MSIVSLSKTSLFSIALICTSPLAAYPGLLPLAAWIARTYYGAHQEQQRIFSETSQMFLNSRYLTQCSNGSSVFIKKDATGPAWNIGIEEAGKKNAHVATIVMCQPELGETSSAYYTRANKEAMDLLNSYTDRVNDHIAQWLNPATGGPLPPEELRALIAPIDAKVKLFNEEKDKETQKMLAVFGRAQLKALRSITERRTEANGSILEIKVTAMNPATLIASLDLLYTKKEATEKTLIASFNLPYANQKKGTSNDKATEPILLERMRIELPRLWKKDKFNEEEYTKEMQRDAEAYVERSFKKIHDSEKDPELVYLGVKGGPAQLIQRAN